MATTSHRYPKSAGTKLERMEKHVFESLLEAGRSPEVAKKIAAATVNKYRAERAAGKKVCKGKGAKRTCKTVRGPKLVGQGGSRRQWYPGKKVTSGKKAAKGKKLYCLKHRRPFKTKAALASHYRSKSHQRA